MESNIGGLYSRIQEKAEDIELLQPIRCFTCGKPMREKYFDTVRKLSGKPLTVDDLLIKLYKELAVLIKEKYKKYDNIESLIKDLNLTSFYNEIPSKESSFLVDQKIDEIVLSIQTDVNKLLARGLSMEDILKQLKLDKLLLPSYLELKDYSYRRFLKEIRVYIVFVYSKLIEKEYSVAEILSGSKDSVAEIRSGSKDSHLKALETTIANLGLNRYTRKLNKKVISDLKAVVDYLDQQIQKDINHLLNQGLTLEDALKTLGLEEGFLNIYQDISIDVMDTLFKQLHTMITDEYAKRDSLDATVKALKLSQYYLHKEDPIIVEETIEQIILQIEEQVQELLKQNMTVEQILKRLKLDKLLMPAYNKLKRSGYSMVDIYEKLNLSRPCCRATVTFTPKISIPDVGPVTGYDLEPSEIVEVLEEEENQPEPVPEDKTSKLKAMLLKQKQNKSKEIQEKTKRISKYYAI